MTITMAVKSTQINIQELIHKLEIAHPDAHCALNYNTPIQLLVATILSAQCTDERVNQVTPNLFARYPHRKLIWPQPTELN